MPYFPGRIIAWAGMVILLFTSVHLNAANLLTNSSFEAGSFTNDGNATDG